MSYSATEIVQRPFFYGVVDEVDSVLIDEARTPLIISGASQAPTEKYLTTSKLVLNLKPEIHYAVDEKNQTVTLSSEGISFCEKALNTKDLYNPEEPWISYLLNSVKAKELFQKDKNYIISESEEIVIVDEFTGRVMQGRRWSDGLHQAVEAKEKVKIQDESQTIASITYQNLFLLYEILSGMTGTAKTKRLNKKIYGLNVVTIPTNREIKRKDFSDLIYKNQYLKWRAIAQECLEMYNLGRPVLVGTTTIEKSELLAALLNEYNVPYRLLNAKPENVESEAEIVAQAGCKKAVTISTNMAGRGTDIILGGNATFLTKDVLKRFFTEEDARLSNLEFAETFSTADKTIQEELNSNYSNLLGQSIAELEENETDSTKLFLRIYNQLLTEKKSSVLDGGKDVRNLGGLHVIGTERHESRRIDNQLRGRSGRQGDPGSSRFFLSLEDKLLRIFGGDQILGIMQNVGFDDETPIQSTLLNRSLESAQQKVEAYYFDARKQLFEYDQALNKQRDGIYGERKRILEQENLRPLLLDYADRSVSDLFSHLNSLNREKLLVLTTKFQSLLGVPFPINLNYDNPEEKDFNQYISLLRQQILITYDLKELEMELIEKGLLRELEKSFILQQIDYSWKEHLQKIAFLRDSIRWRAYGQKDPLTEYKKEAFNYFTLMLARIRHRVVYVVLRSKMILL
jgi:preprotein translocase subunit SecA